MTIDNDNPVPEANAVLLRDAKILAERLITIMSQVTIDLHGIPVSNEDYPALARQGDLAKDIRKQLNELETKRAQVVTCEHPNIEADYIWQANKHQTLEYEVHDISQPMYAVVDKGEEKTGSTESFEQWTVTCKDCKKVLYDQSGPDRIGLDNLTKEQQVLLDTLLENFGEDRGELLD